MSERTDVVVQRRQVGRGDRALPLAPRPAQRQRLLARRVDDRRPAPLGRHHPVHEGQSLEGVAGVVHLAVEQRPQVVLHIGPGQRRAAQQHRPPRADTAGGHLLQVLLHDDRALHQQPGHADRVGLVLLGGVEDRGDRLLDADVDDVVAVVGQDDVDQVLADVVHVALDRGEHDAALAVVVGLLDVRLQVGHRRLHDLGRLEHERQLHLAGAEQLADDLHAVEQDVVDDRQRRPRLQRRIQVGLEPVALAVDDPPLEPLLQRQRGQLLRPARPRAGDVDALEQLDELLHRVVAGRAAVVDQVERDLALLLRDLRHRQDLAGVHDRAGQAGLRRTRAGTPS